MNTDKAKPLNQQIKEGQIQQLANALSQISNALVAVGLGNIVLCRLAKHMLKLRKK